MPKHASADTTQVWISVPHYIVANIVVVVRSYASMYSLLPFPTLHGLQVQHLSSYLQQCGKKLTIFLNHFTLVKGIPNYQHLHIITNSPDYVFAQRMCTNDADDDITLAHNPEEEFDRQTLPDTPTACWTCLLGSSSIRAYPPQLSPPPHIITYPLFSPSIQTTSICSRTRPWQSTPPSPEY